MLKIYDKKRAVAGTDEAGRGCLCGPVTAAAVILPLGFTHPLLRDSKKLSSAQRAILAPIIKQSALAYGIAHVSPSEIDRINILNAAFKAMHKSIKKLAVVPELILVDGNRFKPYSNIAHKTIIKGDGKYRSIAAASVLAKTERDALMLELHQEYPQYHWDKNKGYPTKKHKEAIISHGATPYHRITFKGATPY